VTENISTGGAAVFTALKIEPGRFVKVSAITSDKLRWRRVDAVSAGWRSARQPVLPLMLEAADLHEAPRFNF